MAYRCTSRKLEDKIIYGDTIPNASSFEDFVKQMKEQGYTIKRGKHIAFKAPDQDRFTRAKRLGADYTEEEIISRISQSVMLKNQKTPSSKEESQKPP